MPIGPRRTALAKHSPAPLMMAVPQSGPIISSPFWCASCFSASSSSSETLSEKSIALRSFSSAWRASRAAKVPLTEITARLLSGRCFLALAIVA